MAWIPSVQLTLTLLLSLHELEIPRLRVRAERNETDLPLDHEAPVPRAGLDSLDRAVPLLGVGENRLGLDRAGKSKARLDGRHDTRLGIDERLQVTHELFEGVVHELGVDVVPEVPGTDGDGDPDGIETILDLIQPLLQYQGALFIELLLQALHFLLEVRDLCVPGLVVLTAVEVGVGERPLAQVGKCLLVKRKAFKEGRVLLLP